MVQTTYCCSVPCLGTSFQRQTDGCPVPFPCTFSCVHKCERSVSAKSSLTSLHLQTRLCAEVHSKYLFCTKRPFLFFLYPSKTRSDNIYSDDKVLPTDGFLYRAAAIFLCHCIRTQKKIRYFSKDQQGLGVFLFFLFFLERADAVIFGETAEFSKQNSFRSNSTSR